MTIDHRNHLEPIAIDIHPLMEAAMFSIAVSLKRIADGFDDPLLKAAPKVEESSPKHSDRIPTTRLPPRSAKPKPRDKLPSVADRNGEILKLHGEGWNIYELGARFNLSPSTIRRVLGPGKR